MAAGSDQDEMCSLLLMWNRKSAEVQKCRSAGVVPGDQLAHDLTGIHGLVMEGGAPM